MTLNIPLAALTLALAAASFETTARADPTAAPAPAVLTTPVLTVYGRPNRPLVVVFVPVPTAASEAGVAHAHLRAATLAASVPGPMTGR